MLLYCEKTLIKRILGIVLWEETNVPKVVSSNPGPYTGWTFFKLSVVKIVLFV